MSVWTGLRAKITGFLKRVEQWDGWRDDATYLIEEDSNGEQYIVCRNCAMRSYHPADIERLYCGNCDKFHEPATQDA